MKKIFNLAVVFAALMTAVSFASCGTEEKADEEAHEQGLESLSVVAGKTYGFTNDEIGKSGYFKVISTEGEAGSKVVTIEITTKKDDAKGATFVLGDDADHTSYLLWNGAEFENAKQAVAVENADKIVFCLASASNEYTITSGTVNGPVSKTGKATKTLFSEKN